MESCNRERSNSEVRTQGKERRKLRSQMHSLALAKVEYHWWSRAAPCPALLPWVWVLLQSMPGTSGDIHVASSLPHVPTASGTDSLQSSCLS